MRNFIALIACLSLVLNARAERVGVEYSQNSVFPSGQSVIVLAAGAGVNFGITNPLVPLSTSSGQGSPSVLVAGFTAGQAPASVELTWNLSDGSYVQTNALPILMTTFLNVSASNNIVLASNAPNAFLYAPFGSVRSITNRGAATVYVTNVFQGNYAR